MATPLDALVDALSPTARRLYYAPVGTPEATALITSVVDDALRAHGWDVALEAPVRVPRRERGRLDVYATSPTGRALAIEVDCTNKRWSLDKLAWCAEEFWTDALWIRWRGAIGMRLPGSVCVLDMTRPSIRVRQGASWRV